MVHKKNIKELLNVINNILPKDVLDIIIYLEKNKRLMLNVEKVLEHADRLGIKNDDTFLIKMSLLRAYTDLYLYDNANRLIKDIGEDYIADSYYQSNELLKRYTALYYLLKGKVYQYKYWNYKEAIIFFIKAYELCKSVNDLKLKYFILTHLSQIYINTGDIKKSKFFLEKLEKEEAEFLYSFNDKHVYNWMKGKILFEDGKDAGALKECENVDKRESRLYGEATYRRLPVLLFKADILLALKHYDQVNQVLNLLFKICNKNNENYNKFMYRILRISAELQLAKGRMPEALEDIKRAIEYRGDKKSPDIYIADIYNVEGDILFAQGKCNDAVDSYEKAIKLCLNIYNNKIEVRKLSDLFEKTVGVALRGHDKSIAKKYYKLYCEYFGAKKPKKTEALLRHIFEYDSKNL
ncbi:MAG: tetratricopeptide (TPR) repeat protein [Candidatus Midichloriaceae bacterium]|jgi:tetratricopeptide (TPR) repeat protein